MLSQEELIKRAYDIVIEADDVMLSEEGANISAAHIANGIAIARLLFDMAHSEVIFPSRVEFGGADINFEMSETIKKVLNG